MTKSRFYYVFPAVFADHTLEKFFGQARQRISGHFFIDVVGVNAAGAKKNLNAIMKYE